MPAVSVFPLGYPFFQAVQSAIVADAVVAVDCPATLRAFPFLLLLSKELANAVIPDVFQILNKTRSEIRDVTLVNVAEAVAGELRTFVAVFHLSIEKHRASLLEPGALPITRPAAGAVGHLDTFSFDIISTRQISAADGAVHPAGGN